MKAGPPLKPEDAHLDDENDLVWRLLARAPLAEPDAWFATRTLARCRTEVTGAVTAVRLSLIWRWAFGGGLGLCLALALVVAQVHSQDVAKQKDVQDAFEIMASIDTDSDSSSTPSSWQDSSL
jgi:hypothetical protein